MATLHYAKHRKWCGAEAAECSHPTTKRRTKAATDAQPIHIKPCTDSLTGVRPVVKVEDEGALLGRLGRLQGALRGGAAAAPARVASSIRGYLSDKVGSLQLRDTDKKDSIPLKIWYQLPGTVFTERYSLGIFKKRANQSLKGPATHL
ncbi:hypothetical protein MSG28_008345 [Choristoneura fumiferana]|uniref:Uncharacterized protein n=1 Tax=Choristoneura fumiferana TaxID=7141 RepID=A0ACC0JB40_CHOFU|nr:hypothetical protein MSG28_008345 [Choristoneura fumiferana]